MPSQMATPKVDPVINPVVEKLAQPVTNKVVINVSTVQSGSTSFSAKMERDFDVMVQRAVANSAKKIPVKTMGSELSAILKDVELLPMATKSLKALGPTLAVGMAGYNIYNANDKTRAVLTEGAGIAGCYGLAAAGAAIGGSAGLGIGAIPGAVVGLGLCVAGDFASRSVIGDVYDYVSDVFSTPTRY